MLELYTSSNDINTPGNREVIKMIRLISEPEPGSREPDFVKMSYIGLCLTPSTKLKPDIAELAQKLRVHFVPVSNFLEQMKSHDPHAYPWHLKIWGRAAENLENLDKDKEILLAFPYACCVECTSEADN
jgi:hypothetical protein